MNASVLDAPVVLYEVYVFGPWDCGSQPACRACTFTFVPESNVSVEQGRSVRPVGAPQEKT